LISWYGEQDLDAALGYFDELEGVEFYDELISREYGHDLYIDKGRILAAAGEHREAIAAYEQSFEVNGEFPQGYMLMADSYIELGDPQTALAKLRFALELTDEPLQQRRLLARIRELAGE
jgi:tetratricopeptide (TPR) repeat protein